MRRGSSVYPSFSDRENTLDYCMFALAGEICVGNGNTSLLAESCVSIIVLHVLNVHVAGLLSMLISNAECELQMN